MNKPLTVTIHYNRHKANGELPWTVHVSGKCIPASKVICNVPTETVYQPDKKTNPRGWQKTKGIVTVDEEHVVTIN